MISQTAEYALGTVVYLGNEQGQPRTTAQIAQAIDAPAGYLAKVMQALGRGGLVHAKRGLHGGFTLAHAPGEISIMHVIRAVHVLGRDAQRPPSKQAAADGLRVLHERLQRLRTAAQRELQAITIDQLMSPPAATVLCQLPGDSQPIERQQPTARQTVMLAKFADVDFAVSPLMFYYEVTQACDLVCKHCRALAQPRPRPEELDTGQARALIDQIASFPQPPTLVMTGGDPLKRADLFDLIRHAVQRGLQVALTPSATPLATEHALANAQRAGVDCLGISLDGADAATHDSFRGWTGSFERTMSMLSAARDLGLRVQINTTVTRRNVQQIDELAELLSTQGIVMWSVFFLIPVGRGIAEERIAPEAYEELFERLWVHAQRQPYAIKTTEAPHYRRFVLERQKALGGLPEAGRRVPGTRPRPLGVRDGNGIMFVSYMGEIYPAGFLPLLCGRFPTDSVVDVYQRHPWFLALRRPDEFHGKCGQCEYRHICGGSRSRAYAVTGDPLAAEPDCVYQPGELATAGSAAIALAQ